MVEFGEDEQLDEIECYGGGNYIDQYVGYCYWVNYDCVQVDKCDQYCYFQSQCQQLCFNVIFFCYWVVSGGIEVNFCVIVFY